MRKTFIICCTLLAIASSAFAAITEATPRAEYTAAGGDTYQCADTGGSSQGWPIWVKTDLRVWLDGTLQVVDTDYTVTFTAGDDSDCSITFVSTPTSGLAVVMERASDQESYGDDFATSGPFSMSSMNKKLDYLTTLAQDNAARIDRTARLDPGEEIATGFSRLPQPEASTVLGYAVDGSYANLVYTFSGTWDGMNLANYTELAAITGQTDDDQSFVAGRVSATDEGGGVFVWDSSNLSVSVTGDPQKGIYVAPNSDATGASGAWVRQNASPVLPEWFGAIGDGVTDDTTALDAALDTLGPVYFRHLYKITDVITANPGQLLFGIGRDKSGLIVEADFNLAAVGCLDISSVEPGAKVADIGIYLAQDPDETVRANLLQYPPAILALATPRFGIYRVRISGAYNGIDATGNSGGAHIEDLELGAFNKGMIFDGPLDFIFLDNVEFWIFDYAGEAIYTSVYSDGDTIAAELDNIDGLTIGSFSSFRGHVTMSGTFGSIGVLNLDGSYADLHVTGASKIGLATVYSSSAAADDFAVKVDGANTHLNIGNMWLDNATDLTGSNGLIQLLTDSTAELTIGTLHAKTSGVNTRLIYQDAGILIVSNGFFEPPQNVSLLEDWIDIDGGVFRLASTDVRDKGTGTGNLIGLAVDNSHSLTDVIASGWPVVIPTGTEKVHLTGNTFATTYSGSRRLTWDMIHVFSGTLDGAGSLTIAHGIPGLFEDYPIVQAWQNNGGARVPLPVTNIGGTNIVVTSTSGAGASGFGAEIVVLTPGK